MDIEVSHRGSVVVVRLRGRIIDGAPAEDLRATLRRLTQENSPRTVIDLAEVTWFDSLAVGLLVTHHVSTAKRGGQTVLLHGNDKIRTLMKLCQLEEHFAWAETLDEAIQTLES